MLRGMRRRTCCIRSGLGWGIEAEQRLVTAMATMVGAMQASRSGEFRLSI